MLQQVTVADRILKAVRRAPGCQLDDLVRGCPDLTWNQVFLEVDRMSRSGQVRVRSNGQGIYTLTLPARKKQVAAAEARTGAGGTRRRRERTRRGSQDC